MPGWWVGGIDCFYGGRDFDRLAIDPGRVGRAGFVDRLSRLELWMFAQVADKRQGFKTAIYRLQLLAPVAAGMLGKQLRDFCDQFTLRHGIILP